MEEIQNYPSSPTPVPDHDLPPMASFLGEGWYSLEEKGGFPSVWSKKEAFLNFDQPGPFSLLISADIYYFRKKKLGIKIFDLADNLIEEVFLDTPSKILDIPAGYKRIKLSVSETWKPKDIRPWVTDERELGICLSKIEKTKVFKEECDWWPQSYEIETTSKCNVNPPCVMCYRNVKDRDLEKSMSENVICRLKPYLKTALKISLHSSGEPLCDNRIFDILNILDTEKTVTYFNTNGLLLTSEIIEKLFRKPVKEINVSIDAATPKTYQKIRGQSFTNLKEKIILLGTEKNKRGLKYPQLSINMTLMKENIKEAVDFVNLAKELGAGRIYFYLLTPTPRPWVVKKADFIFDYQSQFIDLEDPEARRYLQLASKKGLELGIEIISFNREVLNELAA